MPAWCNAAAICLLAGVLAGCGQSARHHLEPSAPRLAFGDERSQPLGYSDRGVVAHVGSLSVHDVAYLSGGERVDGYLVEDREGKPRPGVVLVHGSGGDRRELLGSALALARRGLVAMTITEPSAAHAPPAPASIRALLSQSRAETVRDVIAVRRAADVLMSLPSVDARRLGYLGWSSGAKLGAFVAASDRRFEALALLSAGADKLTAYIAAAPAPVRSLAARQLGSVDPLRYLAWARPGTLLLEDGTRDRVVPHQALLNVIRAAPVGTTVRWYAAGHVLDAAAYRSAFAWFGQKAPGRWQVRKGEWPPTPART